MELAMSRFFAALVVLLVAAAPQSGAAPVGQPGWRQGSFLKDKEERRHCLYQPQEGDIVLFSGWRLSQRPVRSVLQRPVQKMATWSNFLHVGLVVCDDRGRVRLLEADRGTGVRLHDPLVYMASYQQHYGQVYVRRRSLELTERQSEALTQFAEEERGKPYAPVRELATYLFSPPIVDELPNPAELLPSSEEKWFCSELVIEALQASGLLSPHVSGSGSAPKHLVGERFLLYPDWEYPQLWVEKVYCRGQCGG